MYPPDVSGKVTIPADWTSVPNAAFRQCGALKSVDLPSSLTSVGQDAFASSGLLTVDIPDSVTVISASAFESCASLTTVNFGTGSQLITIDVSAFSATGITFITIPVTVTLIDSLAFANCASLSDFVFTSSGAAEIESDAFENCPSLFCLPDLASTVTYSGSVPLICPLETDSNDKLPKDAVAIITVGTVLTASIVSVIAYQVATNAAAAAASSVPATAESTDIAKHTVELVSSIEEA
jgi:hypothetical protein